MKHTTCIQTLILIFILILEVAADDKSRLSLANESQYLLISRDSVTALHEKILERRDEGDTQESFGKYFLFYEYILLQ